MIAENATKIKTISFKAPENYNIHKHMMLRYLSRKTKDKS